ncbi:putative proteinase/capsid scaffold protein [Phascolarctid gammaherpesvirus 1]|uniref:Capsid scaffolding protein n=1 Tax=Phascolarctid gammaherpesvirus 1 TaxID=2249313 RepID=A0A3S8D7H1_9GAMA|nr:putative proteinase/capsid scaffold protein [Phascolarctid gammaherpesvirus 1]AZB49190.1 putative proteinase/capsid scaffold protein [Phascolarctid gammaherpesvirus 1]
MIVVGGFLDVRACEKEDRSLVLDEDKLRVYLPFKTAIPLTVEHIEGTQIGWVCGIYSMVEGLFMVGVISSDRFLDILSAVFSASASAKLHRVDLPSEPLLEVLHTWLPGLSLSSIHPDYMYEGQEAQVFHHVSLCALGKRRGTVAVYGHDFQWVLSKFTSISEHDRAVLVNDCLALDLDSLRLPSGNIAMEPLLAKAIDASFIQNRLNLLKGDRQVANIHRMTYLKASTEPCIHSTATRSQATSSLTEQKMSSVPHNMSPPGGDDLISIPRSLFVNILQTRLDSTGPARPLDLGYGSAYVPSHGGYVPPQPCWPRQAMRYEPYRYPYGKHQRSESDSEDEFMFPGEDLCRKRRHVRYVTELRDLIREVKDLKSGQGNVSSVPPPTSNISQPPNTVYYTMPGPVPHPSQALPPYYYAAPQVPPPKPELMRTEIPEKADPIVSCSHPPPNKPPALTKEPQSCPTVDASVSLPDKTNALQKLFCQELLGDS